MFRQLIAWFLSLFTKKEPKPCEALFQKLSDENPLKLESYIRSHYLKPTDLTFAIEILGDTCSYQVASRTIVPMLWHESVLVREGAIYGLRRFTKDSTIYECLNSISKADPSFVIRELAREAMED